MVSRAALDSLFPRSDDSNYRHWATAVPGIGEGLFAKPSFFQDLGGRLEPGFIRFRHLKIRLEEAGNDRPVYSVLEYRLPE